MQNTTIQNKSMFKEILDTPVKISSLGLLATISLNEVSVIISCMVGLATFVYMIYNIIDKHLSVKAARKKEKEHE